MKWSVEGSLLQYGVCLDISNVRIQRSAYASRMCVNVEKSADVNAFTNVVIMLAYFCRCAYLVVAFKQMLF